MIAVDGGGNSDLRQSGAHELENDHLGCGVLTSDPIRSQIEIGFATDDFLFLWVVQVTVQDFLRVGQWSLETLFDDINVVCELPVT
jgi:hypothetical protein